MKFLQLFSVLSVAFLAVESAAAQVNQVKLSNVDIKTNNVVVEGSGASGTSKPVVADVQLNLLKLPSVDSKTSNVVVAGGSGASGTSKPVVADVQVNQVKLPTVDIKTSNVVVAGGSGASGTSKPVVADVQVNQVKLPSVDIKTNNVVVEGSAASGISKPLIAENRPNDGKTTTSAGNKATNGYNTNMPRGDNVQAEDFKYSSSGEYKAHPSDNGAKIEILNVVTDKPIQVTDWNKTRTDKGNVVIQEHDDSSSRGNTGDWKSQTHTESPRRDEGQAVFPTSQIMHDGDQMVTKTEKPQDGTPKDGVTHTESPRRDEGQGVTHTETPRRDDGQAVLPTSQIKHDGDQMVTKTEKPQDGTPKDGVTRTETPRHDQGQTEAHTETPRHDEVKTTHLEHVVNVKTTTAPSTPRVTCYQCEGEKCRTGKCTGRWCKKALVSDGRTTYRCEQAETLTKGCNDVHIYGYTIHQCFCDNANYCANQFDAPDIEEEEPVTEEPKGAMGFFKSMVKSIIG